MLPAMLTSIAALLATATRSDPPRTLWRLVSERDHRALLAAVRAQPPRSEDEDVFLALHEAVSSNDMTSFGILLGAGASVAFGPNEINLLSTALEGDLAGVDTVEVIRKLGVSFEDGKQYGTTPLHLAIRSDRVDKCAYVLRSYGAEQLDLPDGAGYTPLARAASRGCAPVVDFLLSKGADVRAGRYPAFVLAARATDASILERLLELTPDITEEERSFAVLQCHVSGGNATLRALLQAQPRFSLEATNEGWTILVLAASVGNIERIILLLDAGANIEHYDPKPKDAATPLLAAARFAQTKAIRVLHAYGADLHRVDNLGRNALHWAALFPSAECAELLVKLGVDATVRDKEGKTPADYVESRPPEERLKLRKALGLEK